PPASTLFPYTTLFRSGRPAQRLGREVRARVQHLQRVRAARVLAGLVEIAGKVRSLRAVDARGGPGPVVDVEGPAVLRVHCLGQADRKSTRLNSSHVEI